MVMSFNRYLPVILPDIEESEPGGAVATGAGQSSDGKQRISYITDETITRNCTVTSGGSSTSATSVTTPAVTVPLCVLGEVQLRFLCPDDLEEVRSLCQDWFPIGEHLESVEVFLFA